MMQPSILGPVNTPAADPATSGSSFSSSAAVTSSVTAGFIPERHPSFTRRAHPPAHHNHNHNHHSNTTSGANNNNITAPSSRFYSHSAPTRSAGSDFIHVDRSNNRRMMAAASNSDRVDSWIEVGSQPSDSYTSSSPDEAAVITAGLQIPRRKLRNNNNRRNSTSTAIPNRNIDLGSSDEYEDDEDIDGIDLNALDSIGSSITDPSLSEGEEGSSSEEDEEDEEEEIQPMAAYPYTSTLPRPQNFRTFSRDPPQPDHDAVLRASLSTLLSCAAGVRSAAKPRGSERLGMVQEINRPAPIQTLSLVTDSEREAMMAAPPVIMPTQQQQQQLHYRRSAVQQPSPQGQHHQPRQASPRRLKDETKHKSKTRSRRSSKATVASTTPASISASNMTYLTLAVSAGAVILVSAISFSAGYALGKEVGRTEMLELGSSGGDMVKRAASGTVGKVGGRIVMSTGVGSGLRSITVS